jgi:nucleotide-binding universal stress UspA family protein
MTLARAHESGARLVVVNTGRNGDYSHPNFASSQDLDAHEIRQPTSGRPAAEEILRAAAELAADLIVIGIRPRSPVGKAVTGSTAQTVLFDATCPVLAVKPSRSRG